MDPKETEKFAKKIVLSDKEVLEILSEANSQYEKYLEIALLGQEEKEGMVNSIKRDINYPLNIVLK